MLLPLTITPLRLSHRANTILLRLLLDTLDIHLHFSRDLMRPKAHQRTNPRGTTRGPPFESARSRLMGTKMEWAATSDSPHLRTTLIRLTATRLTATPPAQHICRPLPRPLRTVTTPIHLSNTGSTLHSLRLSRPTTSATCIIPRLVPDRPSLPLQGNLLQSWGDAGVVRMPSPGCGQPGKCAD